MKSPARPTWTVPPPVQRAPRRRLGEVLVATGLITEQQLQSALQLQQATPPGQHRKRLGSVVIEAGYASEKQVAVALAEALNLQVLDLNEFQIVPEVVRLLPRAVAERSNLILLSRAGNSVTVATSDPTNIVALDDVKLYTDALEVTVRVSTETQVRDHLARAWSLSEDSSDVGAMFDQVDGGDELAQDEVSVAGTEAAPIVKLVDAILADAVRARASDVHIEPQSGELRIRYRVDGLLRDVMTVPRNAKSATVSRIKIVSGLDIAERRRPQDGRAKLTVDGSTVEARVSTLPTLHGEKVVIRILPRSDNVPRLDKTGLTGEQLEAVTTALVQSQGLILITGPTGSGKTNTLYAGIQHVSTPDRNIVTLEDPVEVQVTGITQVQVSDKAGMTFARGLRSILRQDPDIVLVGETRDQETAELALQASLTGHLVLTTLHTNDAVGAITRLVDMGVEPFLVASSLTLVVAQRLVRTPCISCKTDYVPSTRTLDMLGLTEHDIVGSTPKRGKGCVDCGGTGYRGRTGIYEVLPVTAQMRKVLLTNPTEAAIGAAARANGMATLRTSALAAAHRGETTYEEVLRATHVDELAGPRCPTCARALADDMVCCPWDGTAVGEHRCTGCDKPLDTHWRTCPWCRTDVVDPPPLAAVEEARLPRLLVIDDDPSVCAFVEAALSGAAEVTSVGTADDALAAVGEVAFDAALVDNRLPDLSGIELIRLLRADPRTLTMPLVLFTGSDSPEVERDARRAGADDYLAKPVDPALLEERVLELVRKPA
ncbi:MAG: Flp pilus assembly complex ATPase component TadA [Actinobacteria bacterium]|nr:Flp pilus assembly complex ATPase component TadA [Actinomycetota bacterium]MCA1722175.1 Flp pilus assembly complex ATPase component TadA [Actinomycetota bacterium]